MFSLKFGGTSMGSAENIMQTADIIVTHEEKKKVVTVSAMSGITDLLLQSAKCSMKEDELCYGDALGEVKRIHLKALKKLVKNKELYDEGEKFITERISHLSEFLTALIVVGEVSARSNDAIISLGEILSAYLLALHLQDRGEKSQFINLENIVSLRAQKLNNEFFNTLSHQLSELLNPLLEKNITPICTGFFGKIPGGIINAVGRGYSDFTAALIGKACKAKEIQIWTDVSGILSTDPRIVPKAHVIDEISFGEATELANLGAKVIHPQTIWPAVKDDILVRIKNTMAPSDNGTAITRKGNNSGKPFKSITIQKDITIVTVRSGDMTESGIMLQLFQEFSHYDISIDLISTSESSVSVTIQNGEDRVPDLVESLEKIFLVDVESGNTIIAIVGEEMKNHIGVSGKLFSALGNAKINVRMISQGANEGNISAVIAGKNSVEAVQVVHKEFFGV